MNALSPAAIERAKSAVAKADADWVGRNADLLALDHIEDLAAQVRSCVTSLQEAAFRRDKRLVHAHAREAREEFIELLKQVKALDGGST